jgi:phosphatidylserine decarboxylase
MSSQGEPRKDFLGDRLFAGLQWVLPHHLLGAAAHRLTRSRSPRLKNALIRWFIRRYRVDMSAVQEVRPESFTDFNSFFTRGLKPGARPIADQPGDVACPVDGRVMQVGAAGGGELIQAKDKRFGVAALLKGSDERGLEFQSARFVTLYLSPRDYHRIHMPVGGTLREMTYVPGRLFSVNPKTARVVKGLFLRNERVVAVFDTRAGPAALVLVGAVMVGNIETAWHGVVTVPRARKIWTRDYRRQDIRLERGDEMGRFNMGSTVILLFGSSSVRWIETLKPGISVRMGERIGTFPPGG